MYEDDLGEPVALTGPPRRVVSLVPSLTEAVAATAPGLLVGATDYCTHPADLDVTRVGGSKYPTVDSVLELAPDLVIANSEENRPEDVERLRANGIPVWVTRAPESVPAGLASTRRLLTQGLGLGEPDWLPAAEAAWHHVEPVWATAVIPVWRKPWVVIGRDTFAGDVLRRLGVANVYADHAERYPRPTLAELNATAAELVVLPDEPYEFTATDGPEAFPGKRSVLVIGRYLTWYGPSLVEARASLTEALIG
ncbi:ABC-type Fe3+-hydroxamate transport system, periplasmic component [Alloactinosynnema sp. L-07]|uniref:helical backbone metal receptor n=1 Tax=Alloactinosynnema sp. L-07 TaxID=1653480 RepID=UPI00065EFD59|nr:helical backbone metal receptor [Alloactinosynnema sp. L-07]CRK61843.1 ABC-type Fe3+-hydroxamate transport system, periplasmic component [Alloactinosynnema sp. L-07]